MVEVKENEIGDRLNKINILCMLLKVYWRDNLDKSLQDILELIKADYNTQEITDDLIEEFLVNNVQED